jgi:hypothetical protein
MVVKLGVLDLRGKKWRKAGEDCIMRKELYNLYASPNFVRLISSEKLRRTGHEA